MKKLPITGKTFLIALFSFGIASGHAQSLAVAGGTNKKELSLRTSNGYHYNLDNAGKKPVVQKKDAPADNSLKYNFVKLNLTGIALKNYSLQYERVLNRKFSVAVSYRTMPSTSIPFKNEIIKAVGDDDPESIKAIEKFKLSNYAITPEVRIYLSKKGYGRGFYFAPFFRYASFTTNNIGIEYNEDNGTKGTVDLSGNLKSTTGGFMLGAQWALGKNLCLDWWILGPHYGSAKGNFTGVSSRTLSPSEQAELKRQIEDLDIPLVEKTVTTNANGANLVLSGPWAGVRAGLSFGIRF